MKFRADPLLPNSRHQTMKRLLAPQRKRRPRKKASPPSWGIRFRAWISLRRTPTDAA